MAKTVGELLVQLEVDGIEGVKQLKSSLRGLSNASNASDKQLVRLAQSIKQFGNQGKRSREVIAGQVDALKKLRTQANLGGDAFNRLTKDVVNYEKRLAAADLQIDKTTAKFKTLNQVTNQIPARRPDAFAGQIGALNQELGNLKVTSNEYLNLLRQIQERSQAFSRAQARQAVIGRAQTAATGVIDPRVGQIVVNTELPKTTAALSLRISELKENLQNLDFTSNEYRDTQREVLAIEKQLTDIGKKRVEAIKGVTAQQRRAEQLAERSRGRKQRLIAGQTATNAEFNAALGAHMAAPVMPVQRPSDLYKSIGQISAAAMARDVEMMGNSYRKVAADIQIAARAGGKNILSLQRQRSAFESLRSVLDPTSRQFRNVTKEVERLDKRLDRLNRPKKFSKKNLLQGAGAVASSAIFGGPLGALGSIGGFLVGGPGGAALGGGLGASANALLDYGRQIAEINTQLNLSKQTLAVAANGQEEYNKLLAIARNISRDYAVSLKETIGGFAQVAVAARANNLTLKETETIFRGLVASGIAFGKSQQDIDAIVRATVQVLSKGKLSAEELSGQIGERLPGAVAKFASATGRTLPQLAKDLKDGTVQISDFVDFSKEQLFDYDKVAKLIADGPEKAGARLKLSLEQTAENYGGFFQRVGAFFQDFGTDLLTFFNNNQETIQSFVIDTVIAFKRLANEIKFVFEKIKGTILFLKPMLDAFNLGVKTINTGFRRQQALDVAGFDDKKARDDAAEFAKKNIVTGSEVYQPLEFNRIFRQKFNEIKGDFVRRGETMLNEQAGDTVEGREELSKKFFGDFIPYTFGTFPPRGTENDGDGTEGDTPPGTKQNKNKSLIARSKELLRIQIASLNVAGAQNETEKLLSQQLNNRVKLKEQFNKLLADARGEEAENLIRENQEQALEAQKQTQKRILDQQNQLVIDKALKGVNDIVAKNKEKLETDKEYKRLLMEGVEPSQARQIIALTKQLKLEDEILKTKIAQLKEDLANPNLSSADRQNIQGRITNLEGARGTIAESAQQGIQDIRDNPPEQKSFLEKLGSEVDEIDKRLKALVDPANQVIGAANAIGDAFSNSFMSVIKGEVSARQALANFFSSVANHFADMAAKIIAEAIKMQAIKFISSIIGSIAGSAAGGSFGVGVGDVGAINNNAFATMGNTAFGGFSAAEGAYVPGGLKPFANGGMVSQPTLGLVGEAGENEYIIPQSKMRTAMARYSRGVRGPGVIPGNGDDFSGESLAGAATAPIDVRYNVERINSVDYVTADQFQTGMQQAAQQGAKQGEQQTLKRLQMSGSTRKRIGI